MARHDDLRDLLACVLRDAVREVEVEPRLLPLENEDLPGKTANRSAAAWRVGFGLVSRMPSLMFG